MEYKTHSGKNYALNIKGKLVNFSKPRVMGIINVTSDSFYEDSRYVNENEILGQVEKQLGEGADFIDIGGYSSRPGADDISLEKERSRVIPAIQAVVHSFPDALVSIDTFRSVIAREGLEEGACMINDISGGDLDEGMFDLVAEKDVPYIIMHMRGNPQNMQSNTDYTNLVTEVIYALQEKLDQLRTRGAHNVVVDPGFGFSKTVEQNFELLQKLYLFQSLEAPVLAGLSRKSSIYKTLGGGPGDALNGTTVLNTIALMNGASILRVHDVKEAVEAVNLYKSIYN